MARLRDERPLVSEPASLDGSAIATAPVLAIENPRGQRS